MVKKVLLRAAAFARHAVAARQMPGRFGRMLSIRVRGSNDGSVTSDAAIATAAHVELWKRATSLGGVESLVEHRAERRRRRRSRPGPLSRLSVGLEDPDDLIVDLGRRLRAQSDRTR